MPERPAPPQFERAILWVSHAPLLWLRVGGMRVIERQLFTAARAGVKSVWIGIGKPDDDVFRDLRLPPGLEARWVPKDDASLVECAPPYLGLSADHFIRVETLAHIARQSYPESVSFIDAAGLGAIQAVLTRDDVVSRVKQPLPEGSYRRLEAPLASEETVSWLMAAGPKSQDGFMARHFDRHISLAVSRRLLDTGTTPNTMTVLSTVIGLIGAAFFLGADRASYIPGALLVWLHSVLDGCDGELARVRFQESAFGSDLDFWGDNLVHLALFSCLGYGFWRTGNGAHTLVLAAVADLGVLASATTAWRHRRRRRAASPVPAPEAGVTEEAPGDGFEHKLSRLENALAQRDFIYLLVLLALVDCVYEFLWAAAIGGLLYFGIMLYLRRVNEHEQARQPHHAG
ncbi:MAG TPA: CDP-alcohol phosphatidyltransferase family protein [Elusimicrobiota bacterium]|nr:CDP-alcohol phosphatidyltransferase family protein [Elusimicrobiota bacterium]